MPQKVTKPTVSFPMTFRDLQGHSSTVILFKCNFWATVCKTVRPMLSDLSVTLVYYGQTAGWIKIKLATELGLSPGHIVLDGNPAHTPKGAQPSALVHYGQTAGWIKLPPGMEVGLGPGDFVLAPPRKGAQQPHF